MIIELAGISATANGQDLPRYYRHWELRPDGGLNAETYFGALPVTYTGTVPCITRVSFRQAKQRHVIDCTCGKHQIKRPE